MNSYPDRGYLFSIEGIDGSGKTTTAKTLVNFINISFIEDGAVYFREPTSESDAGRKVRSYLDEHQHIADNELIDLFVADREYDVTNNIQPALDKQKIVVLDQTSGVSTYGAGRFIDVPKPDKYGNTEIDFNIAYNPPCAFTAFATCPLPPKQNRLALKIEAGEKNYGHH